jgi:hypothetical protein
MRMKSTCFALQRIVVRMVQCSKQFGWQRSFCQPGKVVYLEMPLIAKPASLSAVWAILMPTVIRQGSKIV